jgi:hypothetical protein
LCRLPAIYVEQYIELITERHFTGLVGEEVEEIVNDINRAGNGLILNKTMHFMLGKTFSLLMVCLVFVLALIPWQTFSPPDAKICHGFIRRQLERSSRGNAVHSARLQPEI